VCGFLEDTSCEYFDDCFTVFLPVCQQGSHWFDLNDSTVTSIRESDIEKQFQGKESAYMLFYRKTQLHRPSEGNGHNLFFLLDKKIKDGGKKRLSCVI